jgi:FG-GAP-like repeat
VADAGFFDPVVGPVPGGVTILLGDGTGNFTEAPTSPEGPGESPTAIAVGDGDGDLDLAVGTDFDDIRTLLGGRRGARDGALLARRAPRGRAS